MKKHRVRFTLILFLLFFVVSSSYGKQTAEFAVIITIDGLRPDAIDKAQTPNLDILIKEGSYTPSAETDSLAKSLPAHTSLVTGLTSGKHGMNLNKKVPGNTDFQTIFTIARKNGLSTAMVTGKDKLGYIYPEPDGSYKSINQRQLETIGEITNWYTEYIKANKPGLSLIHFPYPDIAGHTFGWMSYEYLKSLEMVDTSLGEVLNALKKEGMYQSVLIVITSDHGGYRKKHGNWGEYIEHSIPIPWLAVGTSVKKDYKIKENVYIYDTAPTVLKALGLAPPPNIDGSVISEIFITN